MKYKLKSNTIMLLIFMTIFDNIKWKYIYRDFFFYKTDI